MEGYAIIGSQLPCNGLHFILAIDFFRNYFPSSAVHDQRAVVSNKSYAVIALIRSIVDACSVFPQHVEPFKLKHGRQGIRRFFGVVRISKFASARDNTLWNRGL